MSVITKKTSLTVLLICMLFNCLLPNQALAMFDQDTVHYGAKTVIYIDRQQFDRPPAAEGIFLLAGAGGYYTPPMQSTGICVKGEISAERILLLMQPLQAIAKASHTAAPWATKRQFCCPSRAALCTIPMPSLIMRGLHKLRTCPARL